MARHSAALESGTRTTARHRNPRRRAWSPLRVVVAFVLIAVVTLAGAAVAFYVGTSGSGRAQLTVANAQIGAVTLTAATPAAVMQPGSAAEVSFTATNSNNFAITVGTIMLDTSRGTSGSGFAFDASHSGCTVANAKLGFTPVSGSWTFAPSSTTVITTTLGTPFTMGTEANNACQGATITIYLKATP
jgi:hypothetical protein